MTCGEVRKFVHAYLDDEFADEDRREFEEHIASCAVCRARAEDERRFHESLRTGLAALPADVPPALIERIDAAIDGESRAAAAALRRRRWLGVAAGALAAAAALALVVGTRGGGRPEPSVVESVVRSHQRNLPVEVASADPDNVRSWFQGKVDVPVRPPRPRNNARLVGGRVSHVREKDAAELVYDVGGRKVSVLIFDPQGMPVDAPRRTRVRDREVLLDGRRGYNVALFQHRGLGYAVAAEGGDDDVLDFVNAAVTSP